MDGPLCDVFPYAAYAMSGGNVDFDERDLTRPWHRVGATRFVPPGRGARSPVFVEWRREDGRWVVSSLGGEEYVMPRLLGRGVDEAIPGPRVPLRLPLADTARIAAGAPWFERNEPISVAGRRLVKYGLPRTLVEGDIVRWGTLYGVGVYVEPASAPESRKSSTCRWTAPDRSSPTRTRR